MVRLINIVLPQNRADEVLDYLYKFPKPDIIYQITSFDTLRHTHISFKTRPKHLQEVVAALSEDTGCGVQYGAIDVMSLVTTRPTLQIQDARKHTGKKKLYKINDRMSIDEISSIINEGNHLTFDYMALVTTASIIAGAGLLSDSATTVIASMLVSPLMGPILSITFGMAINDRSLIKKGMRNEFAGIFISLVVGIVMGICASFVFPPDFRSNEMYQRGTPAALAYGFLVAAPSGISVVLGVSMGGVNAIVGTAISAALLPPIVNAGMSAAMGIFYYLSPGKYYADADDLFNTGLMSFALFVINFFVIVLVGFFTFRYVKDIYPIDKNNDPNNFVDRESCRISRLESGWGSSSYSGALPLQQPLVSAEISKPGITWAPKQASNNNLNSSVLSPMTNTAAGEGKAADYQSPDLTLEAIMLEADDDASLDDHSALREFRAMTRGKSIQASFENDSRNSSVDKSPIESSAPLRNSLKKTHSVRNSVISNRSLLEEQSNSTNSANISAALDVVKEDSETKH